MTVEVANNHVWKYDIYQVALPPPSHPTAYRWTTGGSAHPTIVTHNFTATRLSTPLSFAPLYANSCEGRLYDGGARGTTFTLQTTKGPFLW